VKALWRMPFLGGERFLQLMDLGAFYDPVMAGIVVGGTVLGCFLRCGRAESWAALRALAGIFGAGFAAEAVRAKLARVVQDVKRLGLLRAEPGHTGDGEFDAALGVLVAQRSLEAARGVLEAMREARLTAAEAAIRTLMQAAELAPVFGLAGTLYSLSKFPAQGMERAATMAAIGMAVHATIYGLVLANLVFAPLARLVERRARGEELARLQVAQWFEAELLAVAPLRKDKASGAHGALKPFGLKPEGAQGQLDQAGAQW
jgi:chemotaxis protein MotA